MVTIILNDYPMLKYVLVGIMGLFVLTNKEVRVLSRVFSHPTHTPTSYTHAHLSPIAYAYHRVDEEEPHKSDQDAQINSSDSSSREKEERNTLGGGRAGWEGRRRKGGTGKEKGGEEVPTRNPQPPNVYKSTRP